VIRYAWRDLIRNPRRTLASMLGVALGVGLFAGILFFIDGSAATMTARALAPLTLDMERIVTTQPDGLRLRVDVRRAAPLDAGDRATVDLVIANEGTAPANDVTVHDEPPASFAYVSESTTLDGVPVADIDGTPPLSHGVAGFGLRIGRIGPGERRMITYEVEASEGVPDPSILPSGASVSSREQPVPVEANAAPPLSLDALRSRVRTIPGVAAADGLGVVDLAPGALSSSDGRAPGPVRIFAFDQRYIDHYPSIEVVSGSLDPTGSMISVEAARTLDLTPGDEVDVTLPGLRDPLHLTVSGVVDLARAEALFSSRKASKLEEFLYVPNALVISPASFRDVVIPAFDAARAVVGTVTRSAPTQELDVLVDRANLQADPATALQQTASVARAVDAIAPGQGYLIDNISNALAVASDDAATGRRMFLFLGLPGALLAAFLSAFAGSVLAASERREHATLRVRGANRSHLRTIALTKTFAISLGGSLVGVVIGFVSAAVVLGPSTLLRASPTSLATSAVLAAAGGAAVTAIALYLPARRSVRREVSDERRAIRVPSAPRWRRYGLDVALLVTALAIEVGAIRSGALDPPVGSVYAGLAVSLPVGLLPAPLLVWVGGLLLCVRGVLMAIAHTPIPPARFGASVPGIASRGARRRSGELATGIIGLGLIVAFAIELTSFAATYDATKADDTRFSLGADIRVVPSVLSVPRPGAKDVTTFAVPGVTAVSPMMFGLENAVLIGPTNQKRKNMAAVEPGSFTAAASLPDEAFVDGSGSAAIAALAEDPRGLLVDEETADELSVDVGDRVQAIIALGMKREAQAPFRVVALFERFPGTPAGANLVMDLGRYRALTGVDRPDFFLAKVRAPDALGVVANALEEGPGAVQPIHVETTATALDKERSSLTAVNVNGLVRLNAFFVLAMSATAITIFVFGLLLARRGEYVALRAQGLRTGELRALVVFEVAIVTICGIVAGSIVGTLTAWLSVGMLRGLFVLDPRMAVPIGRVALVGGVVCLAAMLSGVAAAEILRRLDPAEILREE
jgi:putative ABC transport system permease protein